MAFQAIAATAAVVGTANSISQGKKNQKTAERNAAQARLDAEGTARQADRAFNMANQKAPNIAALMKRNTDAGSRGVGGTYLTGPSGAPVGAGMLGRSTLLGR